ncbi:aminotransferase class I/II-fold pyridoxal phosphate-dependent enzyme [Paenibacillus sp. WLX1005]|uniref:aminotransferase class I/II-fold pyridoxal phosphate-dependent enzyme n=1 Tax=Paenibacillus sp. WLX1005 TaxID=3243766 RepID=UPI003984343E
MKEHQHQHREAEGKVDMRAPLYERLVQYAQSGQHSYHVPGHKNGAAYVESSSEFVEAIPLLSESDTSLVNQLHLDGELHAGRELDDVTERGYDLEYDMEYLHHILKIDVTEIEGTDDLHHPEGVIQEGQKLAARCFGAEETHWLIGGSTVGNLAVLLTVCTHPNDLILVQRNVHKSVIHGLMMAGAQAIFLTPELDIQSGLAVIPSFKSIKLALQKYPQARGVLLTSPNYYGMGRDLTDIAKLCHEYGVPLLIDEAHGAHYGHHPRFPQSALAAGADAVVQSTHKMLTAMTMGAMLHVQGELLNRSLLKQRLTMIQSSSPSYPLMASLDLSRYLLEKNGSAWFEMGLKVRDTLVDGVKHINFVVRKEDEVIFEKQVSEGIAGQDDYTADVIRVLQGIEASEQSEHTETRLARFGVLHEPLSMLPEQNQEIVCEVGDIANTAENDIKYRLNEYSDDTVDKYANQVNPFKIDKYGHEVDELKVDKYGHRTNVFKVDEYSNQLDPFKVVLYDRAGIWSGSELQEQLERYGCVPEMSDERYVVLVFSVGSRMADADVLLDALSHIAAAHPIDLAAACHAYYESDVCGNRDREMADLISEPVSFHMIPILPEDVESIKLEQAVGRICAEMIIPYPPGIPILYAGERIGEQIHGRLLGLRDHDIKIQGADDASLHYIKVYR